MDGMVPLLFSLGCVVERNEPVPLVSLLLLPPSPMLMLASVAPAAARELSLIHISEPTRPY